MARGAETDWKGELLLGASTDASDGDRVAHAQNTALQGKIQKQGCEPTASHDIVGYPNAQKPPHTHTSPHHPHPLPKLPHALRFFVFAIAASETLHPGEAFDGHTHCSSERLSVHVFQYVEPSSL